MTDDDRHIDLAACIRRLPANSAVIVRTRSRKNIPKIVQWVQALNHRDVRILMSAAEPIFGPLAVDGLHLSEASVRRWRRYQLMRLGPGLITAAAHSRLAAWRAARLGVDLVLLSPVFPTPSHPGAATLGPYRFALIARSSPLPVMALGGMTRRNLRRVRLSGAVGIAGIGLFAESGRLG